jgi:hypothetical protein
MDKPTDTQNQCSGMGGSVSPEMQAQYKHGLNERALDRIANRIRYHAPRTEQLAKYQALRDGALAFATVLIRNCPDNQDREGALQILEHALMIANKSIALD